jgi:hypothetical protein
MVQVPAASPVTVALLTPASSVLLPTLQVVEVVEKRTCSPESAVALALVELPTARGEGVKVIAPMVWGVQGAVVNV